MKEHPILFSTEMVKAILEGRKTQTRRVITKKDCYSKNKEMPRSNGSWGIAYDRNYWIQHLPVGLRAIVPESKPATIIGKSYHCPFGQVDDRLWVRESLKLYNSGTLIRYFADGCPVMVNGESADKTLWNYKYNRLPSMFMPRWASRIQMEITDVKIQKVQEITPEDAMAEGCWVGLPNARTWYEVLWDKINSQRGYSWESNPWVWCLTFKVANQVSVKSGIADSR